MAQAICYFKFQSMKMLFALLQWTVFVGGRARFRRIPKLTKSMIAIARKPE
jgi:hypothetical protein